MARVREEGGHWGAQLISVSDIMAGLLFIFILVVMLFVLRFREVQARLNELDVIRAQMLQQIEDELEANEVRVIVDLNHGVIRMEEELLFDSGDYELTAKGRHAVGVLAEAFATVLPCYSGTAGSELPGSCGKGTRGVLEAIFVEGHTDSVRVPRTRRDIDDNWDLSAKRAIETYKRLMEAGPDLAALENTDSRSLFSVSGYEDDRPVATNSTPEGRRKNRRIDFRFIMTPAREARPEAVVEFEEAYRGYQTQ